MMMGMNPQFFPQTQHQMMQTPVGPPGVFAGYTFFFGGGSKIPWLYVLSLVKF